MRFSRSLVFFSLFASLLTLVSSVSAQDMSVLFTPDYNHLRSQVAAEEVKWEPTVKSVQVVEFNSMMLLRSVEKQTLNRETLRVLTISETPALEQAVTVPSTVEFIVGFQSYRAELGMIESYDDGSFTRFFRVEGSDFVSHMSVVGSSVAGEIWLPSAPGKTGHRSVLTRARDIYLVEWDEEETNKLMARCSVGERKPQQLLSITARAPISAEAPPREPEVFGRCLGNQVLTSVVDYMVMFDRTGFDYFASDEERASYAKNVVSAINATLINSQGVGWVTLVHTGLLDYTSTGDLLADLNYVTANTGALRDQYKADIVGLFVGSVNPNGGGVTHYFTGEARLGFMVTHVAVAAFTSTHEFGHTLGMGHQPEYCSNPYLPFARGHLVDGWFGDAMAYPYCTKGCDIIPVYSNPHVQYLGIQTGVSEERENWRMIKIAFPVVSSYRAGSQSVCMSPPIRTFGVAK